MKILSKLFFQKPKTQNKIIFRRKRQVNYIGRFAVAFILTAAILASSAALITADKNIIEVSGYIGEKRIIDGEVKPETIYLHFFNSDFTINLNPVYSCAETFIRGARFYEKLLPPGIIIIAYGMGNIISKVIDSIMPFVKNFLDFFLS